MITFVRMQDLSFLSLSARGEFGSMWMSKAIFKIWQVFNSIKREWEWQKPKLTSTLYKNKEKNISCQLNEKKKKTSINMCSGPADIVWWPTYCTKQVHAWCTTSRQTRRTSLWLDIESRRRGFSWKPTQYIKQQPQPHRVQHQHCCCCCNYSETMNLDVFFLHDSCLSYNKKDENIFFQ